ncbi:MAG: hypothetical protein COA58_04845 [Bacteroidetes bacterium]|nr:MAG: hypothetical protein COA58_04845 [Bacteroidota bacterium]
MIDWENIRKLHLGSYQGTYLNSPANGIPSSNAEAYVIKETEKFRTAPGQYRTEFISATIPAIKEQVANLLNAKVDEIALVPNISIALNLFVKSLPSNIKVAFYRGDYPSLTKPFEVGNFDVKWLNFINHEVDLDDLEVFLKNEQPTVLGISHVQWLTGYTADLEAIGILCKQYNCLLMVDATQSLGAISIDVQQEYIDILGSSCYKWPLAGFGNGVFYINKQVQDQYPPRSSGFNSHTWVDGEAVYYPSMKSYEPGHHDHVAFHRLSYALGQIDELGIENIAVRIRRLMNYTIQELKNINVKIIGNFSMDHRAGIICIENKKGLFEHLKSKDIEVSERSEFIRFGLHYYNNEADIDILVKELDRFL